MGQLWRRNARVAFGVAGDEFTNFIFPLIGLSEEQMQRLRGGPAPFDKVVTDLRIAFDIEKSNEPSANTGKIIIYNLNETSRGFLQNSTSELTVVLEVGYGLRPPGEEPERFFNIVDQRDYKLLFTGTIIRATSVRKGPDWITTIQAEDGGTALTDAYLNKPFGPKTSYRAMAEEAIKKMVEAGNIIWNGFDSFKTALREELSKKKTQHGESVSERAMGFLERVLKKLGLEPSIQNNELIIMGEGASAPEKGFLFSPETGLLGSPAFREEGIEVEALIVDPRIQPGDAFVLDSALIDGTFRVQKAKFKGDTRGSAWRINIEADDNA